LVSGPDRCWKQICVAAISTIPPGAPSIRLPEIG
jgi:hypothetical protein